MNNKFGRQYPVLAGNRTRINDRERLLFFVAAGLVFALVILIAIIFTLRGKGEPTPGVSKVRSMQSVGLTSVKLFTPSRNIRAGTKLSDVQFNEVFWPRNQVPSEAVRDLAEVGNYYAKIDLQPGTPLQRRHLTNEPLGATLPLTPGNRAVSIQVDETAGLEGHALPGTRVDVILTHMVGGELTSKVIVENARVLSYGGDTTLGSEREKSYSRRAKTSKTITLDVSPSDALKIKTASKMGNLSLIMRSVGDEKATAKTEISSHDIDGDAGGKRTSRQKSCNKGTMRIEGKEYIIDCDGSIKQVLDPFEP